MIKIPIKFKGWMLFLVWLLVGIAYFPVYLAAWVLHIVARILLAIAYLFMLQPHVAKNVFSSVFVTNLRMF